MAVCGEMAQESRKEVDNIPPILNPGVLKIECSNR